MEERRRRRRAHERRAERNTSLPNSTKHTKRNTKLATMKTKHSCTEKSLANCIEDFIVAILLCLPVKSMARFRCVCKSWYDLLTHDSSFAKMKLDHDTRKGNLKLILTTRKRNRSMRLKTFYSDESVKIKYPFEKQFDHVDIQILGCCNGLICASNKGYIMYVWNPCTKEYKVILSPEKPIGFRSNRNFVNRYIGYGFGYDSKTCDYKFVSIFRKRNMDVSEVEIYNLSSDLWRTHSPCIPYMVPRGDPGVFLNGALHWLANTSNDSSQSQVILSFDMEDEIFKQVPQPERMNDFDYKFVDVLRGCLCLLCSVSKVSFEVWEMKDYGVRESWSKLFKTDTQLMPTLDIPSYHYLRSAVTLQNGETLLQVRLHGDKHFLSYEWEKRSSVVRICLDEKEKHEIRSEYGYRKHKIQIVAYRESLVSVNSGTHVGDVQQERKDYYEAIKNIRQLKLL